MQMELNSITVVITTYYRWHLVIPLVESLYSQLKTKIIIVNDAGDAPPKSFLEKNSGFVSIVNLDKNLGHANALNVGAHLVKTSHMLYIDSDDTLIFDDDFSKFCSSLKEGCVYFPKYKKLREKIEKRIFQETLSVKDMRKHIVGTHSGFIVSMNDFKEVGDYDTKLTSHIDWDYIIRLYEKKLKFVTYNGVIKYSTQTVGISRKLDKVYCGRTQLWRKHSSTFRLFHRIDDYIRLLKYCIGNCEPEFWSSKDTYSYNLFKIVHLIPRIIYQLYLKLI